MAGPEAILPTKVAQDEAAFEEAVVRDEDRMYTLIAMLPCKHLWGRLGTQTKDHVEGNVYRGWIEGNQNIQGAYKTGNFIHVFEKKSPGAIDRTRPLRSSRRP